MLSVVRQPYDCAPLLRHLGRWIGPSLPQCPTPALGKSMESRSRHILICSSWYTVPFRLWLCGIELPPRNSCPSNRGSGATSQKIPPNNVTATRSPHSYLSGFQWTVMSKKVGEDLQRFTPIASCHQPGSPLPHYRNCPAHAWLCIYGPREALWHWTQHGILILNR